MTKSFDAVLADLRLFFPRDNIPNSPTIIEMIDRLAAAHAADTELSEKRRLALIAMTEERTRQRKRAEAAEQGARRYRWLRDKSVGQREHPIAVSQWMAPFNTMQYIGPLAGESLDAAIDSAIAAQQKEAANGD